MRSTRNIQPRLNSRLSRRNQMIAKAVQFETLEDRRLFALLGIVVNGVTPDVQSSNELNNAITYTAPALPITSSVFQVNTTDSLLIEPGGAQDLITAPNGLTVKIMVDGSGNETGSAGPGLPPEDIDVEGTVTTQGGQTYSGTLLSGTIEQFGYQFNNTSVGNFATFDFRFLTTGGALDIPGYFAGQDIGMKVSAQQDAPFAASPFSANFDMYAAKADVVPVGKLVPQPAPPIITTVQMPATATVGSVVTDQAIVASAIPAGTTPTGTVTFNLYNNPTASGTPLFTDTETLVGGVATSAGYTPAATGTDYWVDTYSGDTHYTPITSAVTAEPLVIIPASPTIVTTASPAVTLPTGPPGTVTLSDSAVLSNGYNETGSLVFTLSGPGGFSYAQTDTVSGNNTYTASTTLPTSGLVAGTYTWSATYTSADNNNNNATEVGTSTNGEQTIVSPASPMISTTPSAITTVTGGGQFATIGFWHNKNGQALIQSFGSGLGTALAASYPNLFGSPNKYDSATLASIPATTLSGLSSTQVASVYLGLWTPSGVDKNTYVQAFAVALGAYPGGGSSATYNVGPNGAAFGVANNTTLTIAQILAAANANFNPTTGLFYGGDATLTGDFNNVLNGINVSGETGGGSSTVTINTLNDSATLSGGASETGTITFYLMGPGSTASTPLSSAVYTDQVTVAGNGIYTTTTPGGTDVGGYMPTVTTGTFQWVVVYSGDGNNNTAISAFGSEPWTVGQQSPTIVTAPSATSITLGTSTVTLKDTATLSDIVAPGGTITFTLVAPGGATVDTETVPATTVGNYTTPTGYTLPTNVAVTGTYQWNATFVPSNGNNVGASDSGNTNEQVKVSPATPSITTAQQPATAVVGSVVADKATLSGGYNATGTVTFDLYNNSSGTGTPLFVDTETLIGGVATSKGYTATATGTDYWVATYNGDSNNVSVSSPAIKEPVTITSESPAITTTPSVTTTTGSGGQFATIGFWHNKNGQAVIVSLGSTLGTSLATNYKNLFGYANPYDATTLGAAAGAAPGVAGLTGTQVAAVYLGLWTPGGLQKNTYVQAFAVALGLNSTGGAGSFNVGSNGAAFGAPNGTTLSIGQILAAVNSNFSPTTGLFYGGDSTLTGEANNVLNGINTAGETPGGIPVAGGTEKLNDSATLSGGVGETGTITFYLFAPGVTPNGTDSNNVYTDTVTVISNGTYTTATGTNPGGFSPTATGTYQWVAVYSGDSNNAGVTSPFGSEPTTVGQQSPTVLTTTPNVTAVTLGSTSVTLKDTATLSDGVSPTGTLTWTLYLTNGSGTTLVDTETLAVNGNGSYTTPTGYTLPTTGTVTGTYQWDATYSGDSNNIGDTFLNDPSERTVVSAAGPSIVTTPGGTLTLGSSTKLTDSATLSGGVNETGTVTFYLFAPGVTPNATDSNNIYSDAVTVSGNSTYTTASGTNPGGYLPTAAGTYQWVAVYGGDKNNAAATSPFGSEPETVNTSTTPVGSGQFATIGFWHNQNGQAVINSFNGSSKSTALGNWLATNWPHLFGASNPYTGTSLAGLTNAQVATVYSNLWTPSGVTKNTYVQAFAVALGMYADTSSLGYNTTAGKYGFVAVSGGGGTLVYNVGSNGAAFGVANNTKLSVFQILTTLDANFSPSTGLFYGGDQTKTSDANNILNGINTTGDISLVTADSTSVGLSAPLVTALSPLQQGVMVLAVDTASFASDPNAAAEQAVIDNAVASLNATLASRGVQFEEIQGDDSVPADVHLHLSSTSDIGGVSDGVLGVTEQGGQEVTIITGWNYYLGSDATGVGAGQYDMQSVVSHELGHALGLGHSTDSNSVMYPYLDTQQIHRTLTDNDLAFIDSDNGSAPEPLLASFRAPTALAVGPKMPAGKAVRHRQGIATAGLAAMAGHLSIANASGSQVDSPASLFSSLPIQEGGRNSTDPILISRRHRGRK
jgi:hypothetical protein